MEDTTGSVRAVQRVGGIDPGARLGSCNVEAR